MSLPSDIIVLGVDETVARFGRMGKAAHDAIYAKVYALALAVENKAKKKVSGEVLNVRTGQLRSNIQSDVQEGEEGILGRVYVTRNVPYAAIHEFGGKINHPGGTAYWLDPKVGMMRFVRNDNPLADTLKRTRPHPIPMPERSYMRTSLAEERDMIVRELTGTIRDAMLDEGRSS